jgi:hypothetical protein
MYEAVAPHLGECILELGAGIGNMSQWLPVRKVLILSELEERYIERLRARPGLDAPAVKVLRINLNSPLSAQLKDSPIDTIVSFNVMEHVQDDRASFEDQVNLLRKSAHPGPRRIVIFVPAMPIAYGALDRLFKHFRRYRASDFHRIFGAIDPNIRVTTRYFNLLSLLPWIIKGRILKKATIRPEEVGLIEKVIPFWKPLDSLLLRILKLPLGQSLICVAEIPQDSGNRVAAITP